MDAIDWLSISVGANIGFLAAFFITRRGLSRLWRWFTGKKEERFDLQDLMHGLEPEDTPLIRQAQQKVSDGTPDEWAAYQEAMKKPIPHYDWQKRGSL